jgi:hypothetical protein
MSHLKEVWQKGGATISNFLQNEPKFLELLLRSECYHEFVEIFESAQNSQINWESMGENSAVKNI